MTMQGNPPVVVGVRGHAGHTGLRPETDDGQDLGCEAHARPHDSAGIENSETLEPAPHPLVPHSGGEPTRHKDPVYTQPSNPSFGG
jgi:hypothetical protein